MLGLALPSDESLNPPEPSREDCELEGAIDRIFEAANDKVVEARDKLVEAIREFEEWVNALECPASDTWQHSNMVSIVRQINQDVLGVAADAGLKK